MAKYIMKNDIQHVLECPDVYIGDVSSDERVEYLYDSARQPVIYPKQVRVPEVLVRIFVEALTNAVDNAERSRNTDKECTTVKIDLNMESGLTVISNDGQVVPIVLSDAIGDDVPPMYVHSLIFGHLRTSSNYDEDRQHRDLSGKNGVGVKCTNIFSSYFRVSGVDPANRLKLVQVWTDNMTKTTGPAVTSLPEGKAAVGYTTIRYVPDFKRFKLTRYPPETIKIFKKLVVDSKALMPRVDFVFCGEKLKNVNGLKEYSMLYFANSADVDFLDLRHAESDVVVAAAKTVDESTVKSTTKSTKGFAVSFVNGQLTKHGGQHVQAWTRALSECVLTSLNKKTTLKFGKSDVTPHFYLFVHSRVIKPIFNGQNKDILKHPKIDAEFKQSDIKKILKWKVIETLKTKALTCKEIAALKCVEREIKKRPITDVTSYDSANKLGRTSTLILCEGLSAKAYAVAGIQVGVFGKKGRNHFGVMPLTGKFLNVKNASVTKIGANKVVTNLIKVLNLKHGVDYSKPQNYNALNYGTLLILTDADKDGTHIKGLIINFFHEMFPTLLKKKGFVVSMETPIVKVAKKGSKDLLFYDEKEFEEYRTAHPGLTAFKYYKGLGTISSKDVPLFFGKRMIEYSFTSDCDRYVNKVFKDEYADDRKKWLQTHQPPDSILRWGNDETVGVSTVGDFMEHEMVKYSREDCKRSLGSCVDGLKESQRKVVYAIRKKFKKNGDFIKVAQLSGYVAEQTDYKHGEQNLCETIIKFAQSFVGSNNLPLLEPDGQFGTRLEGGKDAAAPRYIYTRPGEILKYLFREEDDAILPMTPDGEPVFFAPVVPLVLVNGSIGIGTGWSCFVPQYNPLEIVDHLRQKLNDDGYDRPIDLVPYYQNFKGRILPYDNSKTRYVTYGRMKKLATEDDSAKVTVQVTELPIGVWTDKFKDQCNHMMEKNLVEKVVNESTTDDVNFTLVGVEPEHVASIKLTSNLSTGNIVLFDSASAITKYASINDVLEEYFKTRMMYYVLRKNHLIEKLSFEVLYASNKLEFITMVVDDFDLMKRSEEELIERLESRQFLKVADTFNYLLNIPIKGFTKTAISKLNATIDQLETALSKLRLSTPAQMWLEDLADLEPYLHRRSDIRKNIDE